jgi:hypothetical protein
MSEVMKWPLNVSWARQGPSVEYRAPTMTRRDCQLLKHQLLLWYMIAEFFQYKLKVQIVTMIQFKIYVFNQISNQKYKS